MPTITFASTREGAGKTTSAIILATTLAQKAHVTLIDADPANSLMGWANKAPIPARLRVQASSGLGQIAAEIERASKLANYVIIDTEGAATRLNAFAMGESDLVIIPIGDEQPDAEGAIETLAQLALEARALRREIPVRVLSARTQAAGRSTLAKSLSQQVRDKIGSFATGLHSRSAFSSLQTQGGALHDMDPNLVMGLAKAIGNAELLAEELIHVLGWVKQIQAYSKADEGVMSHGA